LNATCSRTTSESLRPSHWFRVAQRSGASTALKVKSGQIFILPSADDVASNFYLVLLDWDGEPVIEDTDYINVSRGYFEERYRKRGVLCDL